MEAGESAQESDGGSSETDALWREDDEVVESRRSLRRSGCLVEALLRREETLVFSGSPEPPVSACHSPIRSTQAESSERAVSPRHSRA